MTITNAPVMYDTTAAKLQYDAAGTQTDVPGIAPTGGTIGQVLAKISSANYNYGWSTPSSSSTPNVFNVLAYGADPTGATSSQAAFQAAINAAKAITVGPLLGTLTRAGTVIIPKGLYVGISTLDCTNVSGLTIKGEGIWGTNIYANGQTTSYPVFDFTGSAGVEVYDICVMGMNPNGTVPTVIPQLGFLIADSTANPQASNKNYMENTGTSGYFAKGGMAIYRSTNNNFVSCVFSNSVLNSPALTVANSTYTNTFTSAFATLNPSGFVANENAFFGCEIHNSKMGNPACASLFLDGTYTFNMHGGIIDGGGTAQPMVWMLNANNMTTFSGVKFYTEVSPLPAQVFKSNGTVDRFTCSGSWKQDASVVDSTGGTWTRATFNSGLGL